MRIKSVFKTCFVVELLNQRIKASSGVPTVFLVNVGQSSDGRVSSVEPAVLIHITVLQMARTVNRVPWVLTTVLTQQYPYGAYPA